MVKSSMIELNQVELYYINIKFDLSLNILKPSMSKFKNKDLKVRVTV